MMTFKQKRLYKRRSKRLMIAAYGLLLLFVLLIASAIWWVSKYHTPAFGIKTENQMISFIIIFVAFPFTGLLLAMFSMWDKGARMDYMRNIKEWRTRNFFQIILDLVERGQLQESISYHNSMSQGEMKSHLFAVLIREFSKSNDPELIEIAKKKLKEVRSTYDPAKVKF